MHYVVALLPAVILVATLLVAVISARRPWLCPSCHRRELRCVNFVKATVITDGRRAPDSWSFHSCQACGAAFKLHRGRWLGIEDCDRHYLTGAASP